jgi:hypothetical protein
MVRACSIASLLLLFAFTPACAQHEHGSPPGATAPPPLYQGLGTLQHKVTTKVSAAQKYFDQGVRLTYAFNHAEAGRAFREAARLDSTCAMAYWGQALVLGPNINAPMSPEAEASAYALARRAQSLAPQASEPERAYIEAVAKRYDAVPGANRAAHDSAYADAMRDVAKRYPDDLDAATLCAEALMDLRPWDLWTLDGKPQPGAPEILSILEGVLKRNPITLAPSTITSTPSRPRPSRRAREPYADRLAKLTPYAGHLVHMPSHLPARRPLQDARKRSTRAR